MVKSKKIKEPGRPAGSPNAKSAVLRDEVCRQFRCSEGYNKTLEALMATGNYKSKSDVLHEALQQLAIKKLQDPAAIWWINKIQ
jgi:hypothetical protein